jgi:flagellar biosynthesis protein FlhA
LVPKVHTRDNVDLPASTYAIRVHGIEVARGIAPPGHVLAIGTGINALPGEPTTEPVFGLPAKWIPGEAHSGTFGTADVTLVDRSSAIITHLGEIVSQHAGELLSMQQVRTLIDVAKASDPIAVEEMSAAQVSVADLHAVLVSLLDEGVPILDMVRIVEAVASRARTAKYHEAMVEAARQALGPAITAQYMRNGELPVITLDGALEQTISAGLRYQDGTSSLAVDPAVLEHLVTAARSAFEEAARNGEEPVVVTSSALRPALKRLFAAAAPRLKVLSIAEISPHAKLTRVGVINSVAAGV